MPPADLNCAVCSTSLETIGVLHYHQMCQHTTEELSLAIITVKGLSLDIDDDSDCESMLLRNGLAKYPQFLIGSDKGGVIRGEDEDEENSCELQGSIKTLDGKTVDTPCIQINKSNRKKNDGADIEGKQYDAEKESVEATQVEKWKNALKKCERKVKDSASKKQKLLKRKVHLQPGKSKVAASKKGRIQNLMMTCSSEEFEASAKEDNCDNEVRSRKAGHGTQKDLEEVSSTSTAPELPGNELEIVLKDGIQCYELTSEEAALIKEGTQVQLEIINVPSLEGIGDIESNSVAPSKKTPSTNKKVDNDESPDSVVTSTSVDNILSPLASVNPASHIEAIITALPNVLNNTEDKKGKWKKSNFVLPSPVTQHHKDNIMYDYGSVQVKEELDSDIEDSIEIEECSFEDYFIPRIELLNGDNKDACCETSPLVSSEKEVQADPSIDRMDSSMQTDVNMNNKGKSTMKLRAKRPNLFAYHIASQGLDIKESRKPSKRKRKMKGKKRRPFLKQGVISTASSSIFSLPSSPLASELSKMEKDLLGIISPKGSLKDLSFLHNKNYLQHSLFGLHGLEVNDRKFFCDSCGKGYKKKSHLERHLRAHTGERPYPCHMCDKSFAVRSVLKQHIRIHTGEKPYSCSICFQRFPQKSGLMTHMMLHTGKPFKCDQCDKAFVSNHKLINHLKNHEGSRPYVCKICNIGFFTEGALEDHVKIHSKERKFVCQMCQATFIHEVYLKVHLDQHLEKLLLWEQTVREQGQLEGVDSDFTKSDV